MIKLDQLCKVTGSIWTSLGREATFYLPQLWKIKWLHSISVCAINKFGILMIIVPNISLSFVFGTYCNEKTFPNITHST